MVKTLRMKSCLIFLLALLSCISSHAQYPVQIRNLWTRAQVHIVFNDYTVSFSIKDINRTLAIFREMGDSSHPATCELDTGLNYSYELLPGNHAEYRHPMQSLMQNVVGAFLLTAGHAVITNKREKVLKEIIVDIDPLDPGDVEGLVSFYDPKTKKMLFQGKMARAIYRKDLGIDD